MKLWITRATMQGKAADDRIITPVVGMSEISRLIKGLVVGELLV